ncbi:caspase family protein [Streptomyces acidiscabies]|uniref:caspase family protein n=1 Tax=Streptomyces acidiscabies TaxID=42234 RepID=UPI0038F667BC
MTPRWVVVAGIAAYDHEENPPLPLVPDDLDTVQALFTGLGYRDAGRTLDATAAQLRAFLSGWAAADDRDDGALTLYFSGHGDRGPADERHYLLCRDSRPGLLKGTALAADDLVGLVTETGLPRLLLIVDTCYAGQGAVDAVRALAAQLVAARDADPRTLTAFSVIAAARPLELAEDGAFARALRTALDDPTLGGNRQPKLYLEQVVDRVNELLGPFQHATWGTLPSGEGFDFLPNPRYSPDVPHEGTDLAEQRTALTLEGRRRREELLSHFGPRGRGVERTGDRGTYFTGRASALEHLAAWTDPGVGRGDALVVTGSAGVGKSSLLGRLVLLADPAHRAALPGLDPTAPVPPRRVDAAIHARHKLLDDIVAAIADAAGVPADRAALPRALAERADPLLIVVDALDEAGTAGADGTDGRQVAAYLDRLARTGGVRLLVGTRPHVVPALGARFAVMDLDDERWTAPGDLTAYARKLLRAPDGPGSQGLDTDPGTITTLAAAVADRAEGNYLVARLTARALAHRTTPLDTSAPDWAEQLPRPAAKSTRPAGPAFRWALDQRLGAESGRAGTLLLPLALSEGAGLPSTGLWPAIASAVSAVPAGPDDIRWILDHADSHIVEALDSHGRSVYRLYHESFADELRATAADAHTSAAVTRALLDSVPVDPATGLRDWTAAQPYVRDHLATHAAAATTLDDLVVDPLFLLTAEPVALQRALTRVTSPQAVAARTAYERVGVVLARESDQGVRYAQLRLAALQSDAVDLAQAIRRRAPDLPWDAEWMLPLGTSTPYRTIGAFDSGVVGVAVVESERGQVLVTAEYDDGLRVWDLAGGELLGTLPGVTGFEVRALTPYGRLLVVERGFGEPPLVFDPVARESLPLGDGKRWSPWTAWAVTETDGGRVAARLTEESVKLVDLSHGRDPVFLRLPARPESRLRPRAVALGGHDGRLTVAVACDGTGTHGDAEKYAVHELATVLTWNLDPSALPAQAVPDTVRECRGEEILTLAVLDGQVLVATRHTRVFRTSGCRVHKHTATLSEWMWAHPAPDGCRFVRVQGAPFLMCPVPGGAEFAGARGKVGWRTPDDPRPSTRFAGVVAGPDGEPSVVSWQQSRSPLRIWPLRRGAADERSALSGASALSLAAGAVAGRPVLVHPRGSGPPLIVDAAGGKPLAHGGRHFPQVAGRPGAVPVLYSPTPGLRRRLRAEVLGDPGRSVLLRGVRRGDSPHLRMSRLDGQDVLVGLCSSCLAVWDMTGRQLHRWDISFGAPFVTDFQVAADSRGILALLQRVQGFREIYALRDGDALSYALDNWTLRGDKDPGLYDKGTALGLGTWHDEIVLATSDSAHELRGTSWYAVASWRRTIGRGDRILLQTLQNHRTALVLAQDETLSLYDADTDTVACRIHLGTQVTALTVVDDHLLGVLTPTGLTVLRLPRLDAD